MSNDASNNNPINPPTLQETIESCIIELASSLQTQVPQISKLANDHRLELQRLLTSLDHQILAGVISEGDAEDHLQKIAYDFAHTEREAVAQLGRYARAFVTILEITVLDLVHAHVTKSWSIHDC